jgi:hypothetical protein
MMTEFEVNITPQQEQRLRQLYAIPYDNFYKYIWSVKNNRRGETDDQQYNNPKTFYKRLKDWLISIFKVDSRIIKEKYKYCKKGKTGRLFIEGFGFQSLSREVRNFIFEGLDFYDYDMKSAHFNIIKYLIKDMNLNTPMLDEYVNNRQKCLDDWQVSKYDVLNMLNSDEWHSGVLGQFYNELKPVKMIINANHRDICNKTDNNNNPISSITNKILCHFENTILQKQMKAQQNVHSMYFDGYIGTTKKDIAELNKITEDEGIEWDIKPFNKPIFNIDEIYDKTVFDDIDNINHFKFSREKLCNLIKKCNSNYIEAEYPNKYEELKQIHETDKETKKEYRKFMITISNQRIDQLLQYFNEYYCVIKGSNMWYVREEKDKYNRMKSYTRYSSKRDFTENHIQYEIHNEYKFGKAPMDIVSIWLKWQGRRSYDKIVFKPCKYFEYDIHGENVYNMWTGWVYQYDEHYTIDHSLIENILYHLKVVVCKGNEHMYEYVLNLWKLILLGKKTGIGLGIYGVQGSGKSTIIEWFGIQIIGEKYYAYVQSLDDLTCRFSSLRCMKSFIVVDEIDTWSGDRKTANKLKSILTQTKTKLEIKNKEAVNIDDYANFTFISNYKNFLCIEGRNDRRYCIQEADSCKVGDKTYFNKLNIDLGNEPLNRRLTKEEKIHSGKVAKTFFHFLMKRDLTGFDTRNIPQTELLKHTKIACTPPLVNFIWKFIQEIIKTDTLTITLSKLYIEYTEFCKKTDAEKRYTTPSTFSRRLHREFNLFKKYIAHTSKGSVFKGYTLKECEDLIKKLEMKYMFEDKIKNYELNLYPPTIDMDDDDDED